MNHFCQRAARLASDALERPLRWHERLRLRLHWWMCASCRRYAASLRLLHDVLRRMRESSIMKESLPDDVRQDIVARCQELEKKRS